MNVLFVGAGKGSWEMRGLQLAEAVGGRAASTPTKADWAWAEVAVLVKRHGALHAAQARAAGVPIAWDVLDFWQQPSENHLGAHLHRQALADRVAGLAPAVVIGATRAQAEDAGPLGAYVPHHSWAGLEPTPPRREIRVVAYQGSPAFLGNWLGVLSRACVARGWRFEVNPPDLSQADLLVALRDGAWDGWACRRWKSGVKLVNAVAAGRPVLAQATAAFAEIDPPGSTIETAAQAEAALDAWRHYDARVAAYDICVRMAPAYRLPEVAARFRRILDVARATPCAAS